MNFSKESLKAFLDEKVDRYNSTDFISSDPISIPHQFESKHDIEISGFVAAIIAWGQRVTIIKNANLLMQWMDYSPYDFIMNFTDKDLDPFRKFVHRTFNGADCEFFMWSLKNIYQKYGDLENAFAKSFSATEADTFEALIRFRNRFFELDHEVRTEKHIANPAKNASAKRMNMFLRWMVRKDNRGVDFGIWNAIAPSQLICPLDIHSGRVARKIGLLARKQNDWKAASELTSNLKKMDLHDPVKYDFALFGLGIFEKF